MYYLMAVVPVNLTIEKGTTFEETFYFTNDDGSVLNLTSSSVSAKLKKHFQSETSYQFTCSVVTAYGAITLTMSSELTSTLPSGRCLYDIVITKDGKKTKLVEGFMIVKDSISI